jgi:Dolichyl-phosphate-mannose-protein mannosyltransferase
MHSAQAQMLYTQKVAGSSPASPTKTNSRFAFHTLTSDSTKAASTTMPIEISRVARCPVAGFAWYCLSRLEARFRGEIMVAGKPEEASLVDTAIQSTKMFNRIGLSAAIILALALATLLLHVIANAVVPYGYARDELYYITCSKHLAFGYVDHPPGLPLAARAVTTLLGDSISAIRLLPAIGSAALVAITGLLAREFGGGWKAVALAALAAVMAPAYLTVGGVLQTAIFDHVAWAACAFFLVRLIKTGDARYWLGIGAAIGIGIEFKHNAAFLGVAVAAGTLLTSNRHYLKNRYLWAGAAIAALIALPHVVWQFANDWPTLEFARNATSDKNAQGALLDIVIMQVSGMLPVTAPVWLAGLWWCLFSKDGKQYRMLALLWIVPLAIFVVQGGSRSDYLTPAYPALLAGGAVAIERWRPFGRTTLVPASGMVAISAVGMFLLPFTTNVLPVHPAESYVRMIGMDEMELEEGKTSVLPMWFADRFGWEEMTTAVADIYRALPEHEQAPAVILARNYGEADSLNFFGGEYGLPPVISGHNNHYLWGIGDATGEVIIAIGVSPLFDEADSIWYEGQLRERFGSVERVATFTCEHCTNEEDELPIYVLRKPLKPLREMWADFKHFG